MSREPRYLIVANPGSLRWLAYERALLDVWGARADITLVPWSVVIATRGNLDPLPAFDTPAIVRLESPGRDWGVAQQLLQAGDDDPKWLTLEYDKGRLVAPQTFFRGFVRVLEGLHASFAARPHLHVTAAPRDIATMFDKRCSCRLLEGRGVPIPLTWPAPPADYDELLAQCLPGSTYVKLNTGSSASAIAVVRSQPDWSAISSVVPLGDGFYSSRRLVRHTGENLQRVLSFLLQEDVCVQRGVPIAQVDGMNFDVRIVVIHGEPAFSIFRLSHQPMTNLHLGGQRGDPDRCRAIIPPRAWLDGRDAALAAAACFDSAICGVDLLFEAGSFRPHILEVNAFGDFFPNLLNAQGHGPHHVEIMQTAQRAEVRES